MRGDAVVLIVDDSESDRLRLKHLLRRVAPHATILEARDGASALSRLTEASVDVVITDQHMGDVSGVDLLEKVRVQHETTRRILITGDTDIGLLEQALSRGRVQGYLLKHWKPDRLRQALEQILPDED
jgi:DNA-binding NarL/FixJ family response regulator